MQPKDKSAFKTVLLAAAELYQRELSEAVLSVWWDALKHYDIEAIQQAFQRHFASPDVGQYMPKPADIVRMIGGTAADAALIAWAKVDKALRTVGPYTSIAFDDAIIHRVVHDMGGWIGLGQKTEDEWPFIANEFRNRYQGCRAGGRVGEYPAHLVGIAEHQNVRNGFVEVTVLFWGDPEAAQDVMRLGRQGPMVGFNAQTIGFKIPAQLRAIDGGKPTETVQ